jgi:cell shape-determining protein MreC
VDAVVSGALVTLVVGVITGLASWHGQRSSARANHTGVVMTGYGGLVDNLRKEVGRVEDKLRENETLLAAAYAELARERADKAGLQAQIATLTNENQQLREQLAALGGDTQ